MAAETVTRSAAELATVLEQDYPMDAAPREAAALLRGVSAPKLAGPLTPIHNWNPYDDGRANDEYLDQYRDDEAIASSVAFDLVTHEAELGARIAFLEPALLPLDIADDHSDDAWGTFYDVINLAAEIGYRIGARHVLDGFDREQATTASVARALAQMMRVELVGDDVTFPMPTPRGARLARPEAENAA